MTVIDTDLKPSTDFNKVRDMCDSIETYRYIKHNNSDQIVHYSPSYLVSNAISDTTTLHQKMNEDDISLHLLVTKFVSKLSGKKVRICFNDRGIGGKA